MNTNELEIAKKEYMELLNKKREKQMSASEEERFLYLYKILSEYGLVDKLPDILIRNSTQAILDDMLETLKKLKQSLQKE